ncbi:MAG: bifunctional DNA-binding transcriptional regulator/O6-methylguanine-DNA methyltransferase Ada [Myxococcales bacterium]|nr:bifunctional DNA-binding transcriptional regulator/O6-methylguanine-DNA methyltransferase Ada [Deltaproteobacteria bacterium]NNL23893.1 bifunctional DNA-binding transcriptional regulator/O6-methylguanine-DNA methyltransferase Ada [Myxococcales bacterium]
MTSLPGTFTGNASAAGRPLVRHFDPVPRPSTRSTVDLDDYRWQAVSERTAREDGAFVYAVCTTGVFCRPSCGARTPLRKNVSFYGSPADARRAGFRACKRCAPESTPPHERQRERIVEACRLIEGAEKEPTLGELAKAVGSSPFHFSRVFKRIVGVTPKQYAMAHRARVAAVNLETSKDVTAAIYDSGYGTSSRFYEASKGRHGMTATRLRKGGQDVEIRYAFGDSSLGLVVVAATDRGICAVLFGATRDALIEDLKRRFPKAAFALAELGSDFERWVEQTVDYVDAGSELFALPLDVRGTAFQELVWQTVRGLPAGQTASYKEIAVRIGQPNSARAVAGACAANPVAVIIPCHRVLRSDGELSGYRWGIERKRQLLDRERSALD